jgi:hypothetical protein
MRGRSGGASTSMPMRGVFGHNLWGGLVHPQWGLCLYVLAWSVLKLSSHLPFAVVLRFRSPGTCHVACRCSSLVVAIDCVPTVDAHRLLFLCLLTISMPFMSMSRIGCHPQVTFVEQSSSAPHGQAPMCTLCIC